MFTQLLIWALAPASAADAATVGASYKTRKSLQALEQCLTRRLSELGDVTAVEIAETKSLMFRIGDDRPMIIDLAPPAVTVTTKFALGTRKIVEGCV